MHGGGYDSNEFFKRHTGKDIFAQLIKQRFDLARQRNHLHSTAKIVLREDLFNAPNKQLKLF